MRTLLCTATTVLFAFAPDLSLLRAAEPDGTAPAASEEASAATNATTEVRLTQHDLERLRLEMETAAARNTQMLGSALKPILESQHQRELDILQSANRTIFIAAGALAAAGLIGFLLVAWLLVRAMGRFSEMAAQQVETVRALGAGRVPAALPPAEVTGAAAAEQSSARFMNAIERLEKRIRELEATTPTTLPEPDGDGPARQPASVSGADAPGGPPLRPASGEDAPAPALSRLDLLLGRGHSLLNLDQPEAALAALDEALALQPDRAETLVKKGLALEKLHRFDEAIACYDRAITLDDSLTIAWLHKGGLCTRLERHKEALECYDQAIQREEKPGTPAGTAK